MAKFLEALHRCRIYDDTHKKQMFFVGIFVILIFAGAAVLPEDKTPVQSSREAAGRVVKTHVVRREAVEEEAENPLSKKADKPVVRAVEEYYRDLAEDAGLVDKYEVCHIYTKLGPYQNSYVIFVDYEMVLKGCETKMPGLGTLYVEEGEDGELSIIHHVKDENVSDLVRELMQHSDVQELTASVEQRYLQAVESDAGLREILRRLREIYEETTGISRTVERE